MDIRMIATDLDGTLMDAKRQVSQLTIDTVRECAARGIRVVLASGRSLESVGVLAHALGLTDPVVTANGARVDAGPDGPVLLSDYFERSLAERVFHVIRKSGVCFVMYGPGVMYQNNLNGYDAGRGLNKGVMRVGQEFCSGGQTRLVRDLDVAFREGLDHTLKFVLFSTEPDKLLEVRRALEDDTPCSLSSSNQDNLEVLAPGCGKGRAIAFLIKHLGLQKEQVMAFGDATNDLTMLEASGYPVAMENGEQEIKDIAWRIAPDCSDSGVARIIRQYVLGE